MNAALPQTTKVDPIAKFSDSAQGVMRPLRKLGETRNSVRKEMRCLIVAVTFDIIKELL